MLGMYLSVSLLCAQAAASEYWLFPWQRKGDFSGSHSLTGEQVIHHEGCWGRMMDGDKKRRTG